MSVDLKNRLLHVMERLSGARVGIVGDLVADMYVAGQSDRVSREAPVLIVRYEQEWLRPGGAANVAANVAALGGTAHVVGLVGDDAPGEGLLRAMREGGPAGAVRCEYVLTVARRETITKTRFLAGARLTSRQQVLRLDRQPAAPPDGSLLAGLLDRVRRVDAEVDAWILSDYGYGSFDDELRSAMRQIARRKPVVADSRYQIHEFTGMTVIKPNEEEAEAAARLLGVTEETDAKLAAGLAERLAAGAAVVTMGRKGMVVGRSGAGLHIPAVGTEEIVDLTGAGDAVAAALTAALACDADIEIAAHLANHAAGVVVMKEGAATASPEELRSSIARS